MVAWPMRMARKCWCGLLDRQVFGEDVGNVVASGDVSDVDDVVAYDFLEPPEAHGLVTRVFVHATHVGAVGGGFAVSNFWPSCPKPHMSSRP